MSRRAQRCCERSRADRIAPGRREANRAHAQADERKHIETSVPHRPDSPDVERPGRPDADGRGEGELDERSNTSRQEPLDRREVFAHRDRDEWDGERDGEPEPPPHVAEFAALLLGRGRAARLERHSADGAVPGGVADDLGMHRAYPLGRRDARDLWLERHAAPRARPCLRNADLGVHGAHVGACGLGPAAGCPRARDRVVWRGVSIAAVLVVGVLGHRVFS